MNETIEMKAGNRLKIGTAKYEKGQERVQKILNASREILAYEGYENLTLRHICKKINIGKGNLSYYFKNKHDIIHSLIEESIKNYEDDFAQLDECTDDMPEKRLNAYMEYLVKDINNPLTRGFFSQIYGMSTHDTYVNKCKQQYEQYRIKKASKIFQAINQNLSKKEALHRATLFAALIDGMMILIGNDKEVSTLIRGFESELCKQVHNIVMSK